MAPTILRSAIRQAFVDLDERLRTPALAERVRAPLLDPATTLLPGHLALVGSYRHDDAAYVLSMIALDSAQDREVLLVVEDERATAAELISILAGVSLTDLTRPGSLSSDETARVDTASRELAKLPLLISKSIAHMGTVDLVAKWLREHPGGLAVLASAWAVSMSSEPLASEYVKMMKAIARSTEGAIIVPWRVNSSRRLDPRPRLNDLAASGAAEDDSDLVVLFYESEYGVELYLAKNRHGTTGYIHDSRNLSVH